MIHLLPTLLCTLVSVPLVRTDAPPERIERRLVAMGTHLALTLEAPTRAGALAASERAARAIEVVEARLSTWREDSELARLNRAPVGEALELSAELAAELDAARRWWRRTDGAFDPAVGGLVEAWGLRTGGRRPSEEALAAARVHGGFAALELDGRRAVRRDAALVLEEGAFGKGAGLDAALAELASSEAQRGWLDLGGQVAVFGALDAPLSWAVADPTDRDVVVLRVPLAVGSLATSGNSERGIVVDGERLGHLLDPRTGRPAPDFGSVTVHAPDALAADCLSTALYVLGPDAALEFALAEPRVDVLVLEVQSEGRLRARATGRLARGLDVLDARVRLEVVRPEAPATAPTQPLDR